MQNNPVMLSLTVITDFLQEIMQKVIKPINYLYINWHWLFQKQSVQDSSVSGLFHMQRCHLLISTIIISHNIGYMLSLWPVPFPVPFFAKVNITDSCLYSRPLKKSCYNTKLPDKPHVPIAPTFFNDSTALLMLQ